MQTIRKAHETALFRAIETISDAATARQIVHGATGTPEPDAVWPVHAMQRLEEAFAPEAVRQIRRQCQCGHVMDETVALVRRLFTGTRSLEAFANGEEARQAGLFAEGGRLYLQFRSCPCPLLARTGRLPTKAWCECTTGYSKVLFEQVFGCEVEVELLEAIKVGDERCLMRIEPKAAVWPA